MFTHTGAVVCSIHMENSITQGWGWALLMKITGRSSPGAELLGLSWVGAAP